MSLNPKHEQPPPHSYPANYELIDPEPIYFKVEVSDMTESERVELDLWHDQLRRDMRFQS